MKKIFLPVLMGTILAGCAHSGQKSFLSLQDGEWRAVLTRSDGIEVPFNFTVKDSGDRKVLWIRNGAGRLLVDSLRYSGDTVFIHMPFFDADFSARFQNDGSLKGVWTKHYPDGDKTLLFRASPHTNYRITARPAPPTVDVSGRWAADFAPAGRQDTTHLVGEFHQQQGHLTGTFLARSGDYRYLEGVMDGDTLKLSAFDGSHIFLFKARAANDSMLSDGVFYSGFDAKTPWKAQKDSAATLPDPLSLTGYKAGENKLDFTFPDINGDAVSIRDPRFQGKVTIIQIMGSWCPNCMDETAFLSPWYNRNKDRGIAVVGLCYERATDFKEAVKSVMTFKKRFDITYPLLITGVTPSDPALLSKTLPQLTHFVGFPTTIFLNKAGEIARIHAGFSGPGTGKHYQEFTEEFNHLVDSLTAE